MRARDIARSAPLVTPDDDAVTALRALAASGLPGLVVRSGGSYLVVPAAQVLRLALPRYVVDDPSLGRVWDEASADQVASHLAGRHVSDLLALLDEADDVTHDVDADATLVEMAAVMSSNHVPLVAVIDDDRFVGVVSVVDLIDRLLA